MDTAETPHSFAVVIAAGGRGERIGGGKPDRLLRGKPLIEHTIDTCCAWHAPMAIAVREAGQLEDMGLPKLIDPRPDAGPLTALESAFSFAAEQGCSHVLLLACDMPFIPEDLPFTLFEAIGEAGAAIPQSQDHLQTLAGLWKVDSAALARFISEGGKSLWGYAEAHGHIALKWPQADGQDPFADIDNQADLVAAEETLASQNAGS